MLEIDANSDVYLKYVITDYVTSYCNNLIENSCFWSDFENEVDGLNYLFGLLC